MGPPGGSLLREFLAKWNKKILPNLSPKIPELDGVIEHIAGSNNSCAGPDGIPFVAYRIFVDLTAPILLECLRCLGNGDPAPEGFNMAVLFLIPKKGTMDPLDHRPISVTNADNRILAYILADAMTPALQVLIDDAQTAFIRGRDPTSNIIHLNEVYYSDLSKKKQTFILFLDTKKAFDTIDHQFILAVLEQVGMPAWVLNMIETLLSDISVRLSLWHTDEFDIKIRRGVKQGCPLSPLLFVLCYDPLICSIYEDVQGATPYGMADDLAVHPEDLTGIIGALAKVKAFALLSGLDINKEKTVVLTTMDTSDWDRSRLDFHGWRDVQFVDQATYLGVLFGRHIGTPEIFEAAVGKFFKRAAKYGPTVKKLSIHLRIVVYNVFILPVLFYLAKFFIVPYDAYCRVRSHTHKAIVGFRGTAFAYGHLVAPRSSDLALSTPLRDLWAWNITLLSSQCDLAAAHGLERPPLTHFDHVNERTWGDDDGSLRITEHAAHAYFVTLSDYTARKYGLLVADYYAVPPPTRRKRIYNRLAQGGWMEIHGLACTDTRGLVTKLAKLGSEHPKVALANLAKHASSARPSCPPTAWNIQFKLIFNALPFDARRSSANMTVRTRLEGHLTCHLCGEGEDARAHVYGGDCSPVEQARELFGSSVGLYLDGGMEDALLICPVKSKKHSKAIASFNIAVWNVIRHYASSRKQVDHPDRLSQRIFEEAALTYAATDPEGPKDSETVIALANDPPPGALVGYTDGSRLDNGQSGAGVFIRKFEGAREVNLAVPLGTNSNNVAELYALGRGFLEMFYILIATGKGSGTRCLLFSDSSYAINVVVKGWKARKHLNLSRWVRGWYRKLRAICKIELRWVRGHTGVDGNERADKLAGEAAQGSVDESADHLLLLNDISPVHSSVV